MIDIDIILLVLKIGVLALLYLFIWRVVRTTVASVRGSAAGHAAPAEVPPPAAALPGAAFAGAAHSRSARAANDSARGNAGVSPAPRLVVEQSRVLPTGTEISLLGAVSIGRSPSSDVVLDESVVSGAHARLVPQGAAYYVEDLGSTNGTYVDDLRVSEGRLARGSSLRIGDTIFRFED